MFSKQYLLFSFLFILVHITFGQTEESDEQYYKIYDNYIGAENSELNNGVSFLKQYRIVDQSYLFFNTKNYVEGKVCYKNQNYKTKLKYDLLNDIVVIKYIDSINAFTFSLNSRLVSSFTADNHKFIKLSNSKNLQSFYGNGFFEEVYLGNDFSFYMKYKKHLKKSTVYDKLYYSFVEKNIYLLKYKNKYYEISKKNDIIKIAPNYKQVINVFFTKGRKVNRKTLYQLFSIMDKTKQNEA